MALPEFQPTSRVGTPEYSKELSGYLNSLSLGELAQLGDDFDISGLARSDLSNYTRSDVLSSDGGSPISGRRSFTPIYGEDGLYNISKYRNLISGPNDYGDSARFSKLISYRDPYDLKDDRRGFDLWGTRNPGDEDILYEYGKNGKFKPLPYKSSPLDSGFGKFLKIAVPAATAAAFGAGIAGMASGAGAGATSAGSSGLFNPALAQSGSFGLTGTGVQGGLGAGLGATGSGVTAGGLMGSGSFGLTGTGVAGGYGAGLGASGAGANALLSSPSFSLISGEGSLNLGLGSRYALPDGMESLDFSNPWKDLAGKAAKQGLKALTQNPQSAAGLAGNALASGNEIDFVPQMNPVIGYTPYQLPEYEDTPGYFARIRS